MESYTELLHIQDNGFSVRARKGWVVALLATSFALFLGKVLSPFFFALWLLYEQSPASPLPLDVLVLGTILDVLVDGVP